MVAFTIYIYIYIYQYDKYNHTAGQRQSLFSAFLPKSNAGLMIGGADKFYPELFEGFLQTNLNNQLSKQTGELLELEKYYAK